MLMLIQLKDMPPYISPFSLLCQRLLMAAGQDLEPYWEVYRQHFRGHGE
jgi:hypothetical protein